MRRNAARGVIAVIGCLTCLLSIVGCGDDSSDTEPFSMRLTVTNPHFEPTDTDFEPKTSFKPGELIGFVVRLTNRSDEARTVSAGGSSVRFMILRAGSHDLVWDSGLIDSDLLGISILMPPHTTSTFFGGWDQTSNVGVSVDRGQSEVRAWLLMNACENPCGNESGVLSIQRSAKLVIQ